MADIDVQRAPEAELEEEDYSYWEVAFWIIGILMIPGVPILMTMLLTPFRGM